jgi:inner membrane protein
MDNLCHTLVGVAVAQAGLKRKTALATVTSAIAANLPDIDVLVFLTGTPSVAFRRGITHGVPAQILLPIVLAGLMWSIGRRRSHPVEPPADFGWLLVISYVGIFTHVFLDFLNTYGVRLLSPISQRWFYGDAVFIVDIWLWMILGAGVFLSRGHRPAYRAAIALLCATLYVGVMLASARVARSIVHDQWVARSGEAPRGLMVGPRPLSLMRKSIIVDTGHGYVEGTFRWLPLSVEFQPASTPKNDTAPGVAEARTNERVRGILIWSRFPFWTTRDVPEGIEVQLRDMRFKQGPGGAGFSAVVTVRR